MGEAAQPDYLFSVLNCELIAINRPVASYVLSLSYFPLTLFFYRDKCNVHNYDLAFILKIYQTFAFFFFFL